MDLQYKKEYHFSRQDCSKNVSLEKKREREKKSLVYVNFDEGNACANCGRVESLNIL